MNHMDKIAAQLPEYGLDAMLITSDSGERYALDFHGEGVLLIAREGARYITDGRYIEAARERVTGAEVCLATAEKGHMELAKEYIQGRALHNVGFESGAMTVDGEKKYAQELPCILTPAQKLLDGLRASKDLWEQDRIRQAQAITDESFRAILNFIRPGMTEQEIAARLVYEMLSRGAERTSFDPIVAAGANGSRPHAVPGARVVEEGMFFTMGHPTQEMEEVYAAVLAAQKAGIQAARAGVPGSEIDAAARRSLQDAGYGAYFTHGFGHSLGLDIHEKPNASTTEKGEMPVGAVISAEPGVYLPGRFGVRIEDVLILSETGCEDITRSPKDLIVL